MKTNYRCCDLRAFSIGRRVNDKYVRLSFDRIKAKELLDKQRRCLARTGWVESHCFIEMRDDIENASVRRVRQKAERDMSMSIAQRSQDQGPKQHTKPLS